MIQKIMKSSRGQFVRALFVSSMTLFCAVIYAAPLDLDTLQPGQWGMAENSKVSVLDPCPLRNCSYSGSDGQAHIMGAWNGGAYDTTRNRLIIWGGGHNNYGGNEIYTFDIATMAWARITEPSILLLADKADCAPSQATCSGGRNTTGYYSDGKPASRHTANALAYAANVDQFFSMALGSSFGSTGSQGFDVDSFNFKTGAWKTDWQNSPGNLYGAAGTLAVYNPVTGKIWYHASGNSPLAQFDPTAGPTGTWTTSTVTSYSNGEVGGLMDYKRNRMVSLGGPGGLREFVVWDLNNLNAPPIGTVSSAGSPTKGASGGIALESQRGVGFVYDPIGDRYLAWHGGTTVYALDPETWAWSVVPLYSGNTVTPTPPNDQGTYGRMSYIPSKQAFILVNQTTENVYFFKIAPGSTPTPTATLTANTTSVPQNGAATLTWASTDAASCTASGAWTGGLEISGTQSTANLTATSTYNLACIGPGGSATATVTITVDGGDAPAIPGLPTSPDSSVTAASGGGGVVGFWEGLCLLLGLFAVQRHRARTRSLFPWTLLALGGVAISPALAGDLVNVTLTNTTNTTQNNAVSTFGHYFKAGDLPNGITVGAKRSDGTQIALQVDKKVKHADGSLRHAILTARLPTLAGSSSEIITLYTQPDSTAGSPITPSDLPASFDARVSLDIGGTVYSASAKELLASTTPKVWLSGPEVSEWIVGGPVKNGGIVHPHLTAYFHIRAYSGSPITKVRVDTVVENSRTSVKIGAMAFTYIPTVTIGNTLIYDNEGARLTHHDHARWHQVGWWNNTDSKIFVKPDTRYLRDSKAVPNYASVAPQESLLNGYTQAVVPLTVANLRPAWNPGGSHPQIGLMPEWYASYVMSEGDIRAYNAVLANDSAGGAFSYHYRDENTGLPPSIDTNLNMSEQDSSSMSVPTRNNPYYHESEHAPLIGYLGYLLTGDYYYLEELQFLANWRMLHSSVGNREGAKGILTGGNRDMAWAMRTLAAAAAITPDDSVLKSYFTNKLNNNIDDRAGKWSLPSTNTLGALKDNVYPIGYYAPWQMDFFVSVINWTAELGFNSSNALSLRNWVNKWPTGRMGQDNSGYCPYYSALYNFGDDGTGNGPDYDGDGKPDPDRGIINPIGAYRTFAELYKFKFPVESAQPCPTSGVMRVGYDAGSFDYYANTLQVALAMAVDSGVATQATWDKFVSIAPSDYSRGGTWGIVPRPGGSATVPNVTLVANPSQVVSGEGTSLEWIASNATSCTAPWTTSQTTSGKQAITNITSATTYTLTCTGAGGNSSAQAVTVTLATPAPTVTFSADVLSIAYNASTTLRWTSTNAVSCTASGAWSGNSLANAGSQSTGMLISNKSYTLTCTSAAGVTSAAKVVNITVAPAPAVPTVTLSASLLSVGYNGSSTLNWTSTNNATSCTASGSTAGGVWSGSKSTATSASQTLNNLTTTGTYTLTCANASGSSMSQSVTINVALPPLPTVSLTARLSPIGYNGSTTLDWVSTGATSCTAGGSWNGARDPSGSQGTGSLAQTVKYNISCIGPGGTSPLSEVTVTVSPPPTPVPTVTISADPPSVFSGGETALVWSSTNATSCIASSTNSNGWIGSKALADREVRTGLVANTTFTLTCSGTGGSSGSQSVTVNVVALAPPTVTISANPSSVSYRGSTNLSWSSTNATTCVGSGGEWSGDQKTSDNRAFRKLKSNTTYSVSCSGPGGTTTQEVTVAVAAPHWPKVFLGAIWSSIKGALPPTESSALTVRSHDSVTLAWSSVDADTCTGSSSMTNGVEGWSGEQPTEGDVVVGPLTESGSLMMECKGPIGSEIQTVAITVVDATTDAADSPTSSTKKVGGGVVDLFLLSGLLLLMAGARRTNGVRSRYRE